MPLFECVIFDWSGTLSDDKKLCLDADNRLLARHGHAPITMKKFIEYYTTPDLVGFYEREFGIRFASYKQLMREYEQAMRESPIRPKPYPHAARALAALKRGGLRLFVLSAHPTRVLKEEVRQYGFNSFFKEVTGGVWDKAHELTRIIRENDFAPSEALFVGDVVLDVLAGKKAGIKTCACTYGYHPRSWLARARPDYLIKNLGGLLELVDVV